jgi:hypothetical protein
MEMVYAVTRQKAIRYGGECSMDYQQLNNDLINLFKRNSAIPTYAYQSIADAVIMLVKKQLPEQETA